MSKYKFKITVEPVDLPQGADAEPLSFEVENHDDILSIVKRLQKRPDLTPGSAEPLGVGLKLFGEVMMGQKQNPLFATLLPHFGEFMQRLKQQQ